MFGDRGNSYPMNYMGKTTDTFGTLKFQLPQNLWFKPKFLLQVHRESNIELLMLV